MAKNTPGRKLKLSPTASDHPRVQDEGGKDRIIAETVVQETISTPDPHQDLKNRLKGYCDALDVELARLRNTNIIRLGGSDFSEISFIEDLEELLSSVRQRYQAFINSKPQDDGLDS